MAGFEGRRAVVSAEDAAAMARAASVAQEAWTATGLAAMSAGRGSLSYLANFVSRAEHRRPEYRGVFDALAEGYLWPMVAANPVTRRIFRGLSRTEALAADVRAEESWRRSGQLFAEMAERFPVPAFSRALAWAGRAMESHADVVAARMRGREVWTPETASMALVRLDMSLYRALREDGADRGRAVELFDRAVELLGDELAQDGVDVGAVMAEKERVVAWGIASPGEVGSVFSRLYSASVAGARPDTRLLEVANGEASASWGGAFAFSDGSEAEGYATEVRAPLPDALSLASAMARAQLDCAGGGDGDAWVRATYLTSDVVERGPDGERRSMAVSLAAEDRTFARALSDERNLSAMAEDDGLSRGAVKWAARRALLATLMAASTTPAVGDEATWGALVSRIPAGPLADPSSGGRRSIEASEVRRVDYIGSALSGAVSGEADAVGPKAMARALLSRGWSVEDVLAASSVAASAMDLHSAGHAISDEGTLARFASEANVAAELSLSGVHGNPLEQAAALISAPGSPAATRDVGVTRLVDPVQGSVELKA